MAQAYGGSRVEEERDKASHGSHNRDAFGRTHREPHRLGMIGSRPRPEEVIPEMGTCPRAAQARGTRAFQLQVFTVGPSVFPDRLSPRSRSKIRIRGRDAVLVILPVKIYGNLRGIGSFETRASV